MIVTLYLLKMLIVFHFFFPAGEYPRRRETKQEGGWGEGRQCVLVMQRRNLVCVMHYDVLLMRVALRGCDECVV